MDRTIARLQWHRQIAINRAAEAGEFQPLMQAGVDDGYAVAHTKGCGAPETKGLVASGLRYLD